MRILNRPTKKKEKEKKLIPKRDKVCRTMIGKRWRNDAIKMLTSYIMRYGCSCSTLTVFFLYIFLSGSSFDHCELEPHQRVDTWDSFHLQTQLQAQYCFSCYVPTQLITEVRFLHNISHIQVPLSIYMYLCSRYN